MKAQLKRAMARVDAMTLRERVLIFVCVLAVLGGLAYVLFVLPLMSLQKQRAAQLDQRSAEMDAQRDRMQGGILEGRRAHATQLGADIARMQGDLDAVEREIAAFSESGAHGTALPEMLKRVVRRTDKVALVRVTSGSGEAGTAAPPGVAGSAGSGLDITLAGRYLDLMEYLATLEASLPQARWGSLRLNTETVPPQLSVRIVMSQGRP